MALGRLDMVPESEFGAQACPPDVAVYIRFADLRRAYFIIHWLPFELTGTTLIAFRLVCGLLPGSTRSVHPRGSWSAAGSGYGRA